MFNLNNIVKKNKATFYDFAAEEPLPSKRRVIIKILIALLAAIFFSNLSKDLINITLTVFSILLGFSFNILFYLVTLSKDKNEDENLSLEKQLKKERLETLTQELFYNVSYFNLVAVLLILISLMFFINESVNSSFIADILNLKAMNDLNEYLLTVKVWTVRIFTFVFYLALIESIYTFVRTIGRVSYFFAEKIKLQNEMTKKRK